MAKNNKFVAGSISRHGVFIPMFRGSKEECFKYAERYQHPLQPMIVRVYKYVDELKPYRNVNKIKLSGE